MNSIKKTQPFNLLRKIINCFSSDEEIKKSKPFISKLNNRSLLILHGPDTFKLLQGLTTNDVNLLKNQINTKTMINQRKFADRVSIYTLFLSPKGKLITDAFIYRPKIFLNGSKSFQQDQLWIDVDSSMKKQLFFHLQRYLWKKQVELVDVEKQPDSHKPTVHVGYNHISCLSPYLENGSEIEFQNSAYREQEYANSMFFDPRGGNYGRRIICMQEQMGIPFKQFELKDQQDYKDFQTTLGFTSSNLTTKKLPFQFNFDLINAISFKKGCYLGQEIVSRSYFTGIVRRRVFPFLLKNQNQISNDQLNKITEGTKLSNNEGLEVGKVIYYEKGKTGLALVNYLNFFNSDSITNDNVMKEISIKQPFEGVVFCPFHMELNKYLSETRQKQKNLQELDI